MTTKMKSSSISASDLYNLMQEEFPFIILDIRTKPDYMKAHIKRSVCVRVMTTVGGKMNLLEVAGPGPPIWSSDCWWDSIVVLVMSGEDEKQYKKDKKCLESAEREKKDAVIISTRWENEDDEEFAEFNESGKRRKLSGKEKSVLDFLEKEGLARKLHVLVADDDSSNAPSGLDQFTECYPFLTTKHTKGSIIPGYPSEIIPGFLYLGDWQHASSPSQLNELKITHIVTAHTDKLKQERNSKVKYTKLHFEINDEFDADISVFFADCNSFLESCQTHKRRVLVHCGAGVSRSATLCVAFLMKTKGWGAMEALKFLKGKRSKVLPNTGFVKALQKYESELGIVSQGLSVPDEPLKTSVVPSRTTLATNLRLEVWKDGDLLPCIDLHEKSSHLIGRMPLCDIVLEHASLSRKHAKLTHNEGSDPVIEDLTSAHGTKLNRVMISPLTKVKLSEGDEIQFGASSRIYVIRGVRSSDSKWEGEADDF